MRSETNLRATGLNARSAETRFRMTNGRFFGTKQILDQLTMLSGFSPRKTRRQFRLPFRRMSSSPSSE